MGLWTVWNFGGHLSRLMESKLSFIEIVNCITGRVRCRAVLLKCPFVMTAFCWVSDLTVVVGVGLCNSSELS